MNKLTFATSNKGKQKEAEKILNTEISRENIDTEEIQAIQVSEIAEHKARKAYEKLQKPVIVDDTGLFLDEWNGFPGALVKWIIKSKGAEGLCEIIDENRSATAKTSIGLCIDGEVETFTGEVEGQIAQKPRGEDGFGWDPVFIPDGYDRTFAEMDEDEKNQISMRNQALLKLKEHPESE